MKATRKQVAAALRGVGVLNRFSLKTVSFQDLARGESQFCLIRDWDYTPGQPDAVREALRPLGVLLDPASTPIRYVPLAEEDDPL